MAADAVSTAIEVGRKIGPVFTLKPKTKAPSIEDGFYAARSRQDDILDMASTRPGHLWALRTGRASGVVVIDADSAEAYEYMQGRFGAPHVSTTRGGHWYFRHPGGGKVASVVKIGKNSDDLPTDLDRKADGGYVGIPPLGNKSWVDGIPDKHALSALPDDLRGRGTITSAAHDGMVNADAADAITAEIPPNGRHNLMLMVTGVMLRHGVGPADVTATLLRAWGDAGALTDDARRDIEGGVSGTEAKLKADEPVWGVPKLNDEYPGLFDRLRTAYGWVQSRHVATGGRSHDATNHAAPEPFAFSDLATAPTDPPEMLVPGIVVRGLVHSIYAAAGTGKTWTALYAVARTVERGEKVVYVDKENGPRLMRERLTLMGIDLAACGHLIRYAPFPNAGLDRETVAAWAAILDRERPALVVFDSWVGFLASCGLDENSAVDIAAWSEAYAAPARSRGIAVLILDHVPKAAGPKTARGSSRKLDYVDVQFEQTSNTFDRDRMGQVKLSKRKDREAWLPSMQVFDVGGKRGGVDGSRITRDTFVFRPIDDPFEADSPDLTSGERTTLDALVDGMSYAEWRKAAGNPDSTFNRHRADLTKDGFVELRDDGYYYVSPARSQRSMDLHGRDGRDTKDRASNAHHPTGGRVGVPDGGDVAVDAIGVDSVLNALTARPMDGSRIGRRARHARSRCLQPRVRPHRQRPRDLAPRRA